MEGAKTLDLDSFKYGASFGNILREKKTILICYNSTEKNRCALKSSLKNMCSFQVFLMRPSFDRPPPSQSDGVIFERTVPRLESKFFFI